MGSLIWFLLILCCGCVNGLLRRWLQLTDYDCQGCNQYYDEDTMFMSMLFVSPNKLILGGRNTIYTVDMETDSYTSYDDEFDILKTSVENCINEGRRESDCQNYYKVLLMLSETDIMACGTWGFAPKCDVRSVNALEFRERAHVRNGKGFCPASPSESTSYLKLSGDIGFAGTCTDACTSDKITRFNLQPGSLASTSYTFDTKDMLSDPVFVYSFEEGDHVYFVFRETASELATEKIFSRIGRICKNDVGSSSSFMQNFFLSFFKARFYCTSSQAGQQPFDHDEVDGATYIDGVLYATFSGPKNLQTGSIVCSFPVSSIDSVFDGSYLTYDEDIREWKTSPNKHFNCNRKKGEQEAIKWYLMSANIHNLSPIFNTQSTERLTSISSDTFEYEGEDIVVLYAASDLGKVHRIAFIKDRDSTVYHTSYKVGDGEVQQVTYGDGHVYALGANWVTSIPVKQECSAQSCGECVESHFPYCGWCYDVSLGKWSCSTKAKCPLRNWDPPTVTCPLLPTFIKTPQNRTHHEGETAQFQCTSHDSEVVWTKDGARLPTKTGFLARGNIYIPEVKLEDSGFYECSINNTSGVVTSSAYLYVQVPVRFREQPSNVSVTNGHQDLVLNCVAEGLPLPEIWWERTNGQLPDGSQQLSNGDLKIIRVMKGDEGAYTCFARNDIGGVIQSEPAYVTLLDNTDPYSPAADESSYDSPISITVLTIGIVISAVVCFVIGLAVHMVYRRRKQKRDYIDSPTHGNSLGQYAPFVGGCPRQDDTGYLRPTPSWNGGHQTWESYHHPSHSAFSPDTRLTYLMGEEEAPPAYCDTYPRSADSADYAEIRTFPLRPPPMSPPVLPLNIGPMSPLPLSAGPLPFHTSLPHSRDYLAGGAAFPHSSLHSCEPHVLQRPQTVLRAPPHISPHNPSTVSRDRVSPIGQTQQRLQNELVSDYSTKLQVSSNI